MEFQVNVSTSKPHLEKKKSKKIQFQRNCPLALLTADKKRQTRNKQFIYSNPRSLSTRPRRHFFTWPVGSG